MLSPQQLYETYSNYPCVGGLVSPYSQLTLSEVYNPASIGDIGAGTPINWLRIINFFKQVRYPCLESAPNVDSIMDTGQNKLCLTFRFLQSMDIEAYKERQPSVRAGTSHSVRNTCDLSRACYLISNNLEHHWYARMATEYLEYFAHNSLPDCFMMCGPDLVNPVVSEYYRAPGYKVQASEPVNYSGATTDDPDQSILEDAAQNDAGMLCFPSSGRGVAGAAHKCDENVEEDPPCISCQECPRDPETGVPTDPAHPCCNQGSIYYYNACCNERKKSTRSRLVDWSLWVKSDDGIFDGTIQNGRVGERIKQVGLLERACYDGYADFTSQCSAYNLPIIFEDTFLKDRVLALQEFQHFFIYKARTISLVLKATVDTKTNINTDTQWMTNRIKDLLWNGYGVLLLTNIGFPNIRDSTGVSYPDRIFYQSYSIIGYDDTRTLYNECVYVLQCPFGDWNSGGHPEWGPLPTGSFLVTETHLKCMISYFPTWDFIGCEECGLNTDNCPPMTCQKQQKAFGLLFAVSVQQGFPAQELNHEKYYPVESIKEILKERKLYYKPT